MSLRPNVRKKQPGKAHASKTTALGSLCYIRIRMWPKLPKGTSTHQDLSFAPTPTATRPFVTSRHSLENLMFRKTAVFGHFGRIRPFSVADSDPNYQKAH